MEGRLAQDVCPLPSPHRDSFPAQHRPAADRSPGRRVTVDARWCLRGSRSAIKKSRRRAFGRAGFCRCLPVAVPSAERPRLLRLRGKRCNEIAEENRSFRRLRGLIGVRSHAIGRVLARIRLHARRVERCMDDRSRCNPAGAHRAQERGFPSSSGDGRGTSSVSAASASSAGIVSSS
jgi:hypothetical protein